MKRPIADRRRDLLVLRGYDREELAKLPLKSTNSREGINELANHVFVNYIADAAMRTLCELPLHGRANRHEESATEGIYTICTVRPYDNENRESFKERVHKAVSVANYFSPLNFHQINHMVKAYWFSDDYVALIMAYGDEHTNRLAKTYDNSLFNDTRPYSPFHCPTLFKLPQVSPKVGYTKKFYVAEKGGDRVIHRQYTDEGCWYSIALPGESSTVIYNERHLTACFCTRMESEQILAAVQNFFLENFKIELEIRETRYPNQNVAPTTESDYKDRIVAAAHYAQATARNIDAMTAGNNDTKYDSARRISLNYAGQLGFVAANLHRITPSDEDVASAEEVASKVGEIYRETLRSITEAREAINSALEANGLPHCPMPDIVQRAIAEPYTVQLTTVTRVKIVPTEPDQPFRKAVTLDTELVNEIRLILKCQNEHGRVSQDAIKTPLARLTAILEMRSCHAQSDEERHYFNTLLAKS